MLSTHGVACASKWLVLALLLAVTPPVALQAQFTFATNNGALTITGYTGPGGAVTIPDTTNGLPVTSIGNNAFYYSTNLTSATIPNTVTNIGEEAFSHCTSLTSVSIPNSVVSIGSSAFFRCYSLNAITVDALNASYSSVDGVLFNKSQTTLIQYPLGKSGSYTIPNGVTNIVSEAFRDCPDLISITIPDSVASIGSEAFRGCLGLTTVTIPKSVTSIGDNLFSFCTNLSAIAVDALNSSYSSVDGVLFNKSQTLLIQCPGGRVGNYTIPNSATILGSRAFWSCTSLASVTIPNSVAYLGQAVFRHCSGLTRITIPSSVINMGGLTFDSCINLTGVYFRGNAPTVGGSDLFGDSNATVYYLPGITGWETTYYGRPTALWLPLGNDPGIQTNQFGFNISWASGMDVAVDACTDLANPVWTPLQTNTLTSDTLYFSDPEWMIHPARFYRLRWP